MGLKVMTQDNGVCLFSANMVPSCGNFNHYHHHYDQNDHHHQDHFIINAMQYLYVQGCVLNTLNMLFHLILIIYKVFVIAIQLTSLESSVVLLCFSSFKDAGLCIISNVAHKL